MSRYSPFKLHFVALIVLLFALTACGGGSDSEDFSQEVSISAKPAFLDRGCTPGQVGPQRFCPHAQQG